MQRPGTATAARSEPCSRCNAHSGIPMSCYDQNDKYKRPAADVANHRCLEGTAATRPVGRHQHRLEQRHVVRISNLRPGRPPPAPNSSAEEFRRWFPSPFLRGSVLFQLAGWPLVLTGAVGSPWLFDALLFNHLLAFAASLRPQDTWLGPNLVRLPPSSAQRGEIALTFDDGPDPEVTPAVLDLLDRRQIRASFFCIAERARRHPELVREISARGHFVENHSDRHGNLFAMQGPRRMYEELRRAQQTLGELTGRAPVFFRAPFGIRNPWVIPVLDRLQLRLVSWTRRGYDAVVGDPDRVAGLLLRKLRGGDILLLHDGSCARDRQGKAVVMEVLPRLLDAIARTELRPVPLTVEVRPPSPVGGE